MIAWVIFGAGIAVSLYFSLRHKTPAVTELPDETPVSESPIMVARGDFTARITEFGRAVSIAEGFGEIGAIPTRYHNPGDLKPPDGSNNFWSGQTGVGTGGHAIFDSDASGFAALYRQIRLWQSGKSNVIFPYFTFEQAAREYAENWQPWLANVTRELGVKPTDTLGEYFDGKI